MSYIEQINSVTNLTISDIISISQDLLPHQYHNKPWNLVNHGVGLLSAEDQLCAYIMAYAEMHEVKCRAAFQNFPFDELVSGFEIIDWGCGQGIASLTLIEMLRDRDKLHLLQKVTLIEPSDIALRRAVVNVKKATNGARSIVAIRRYLPNEGAENEITGITYEKDVVIHLFSNILDIPSVNLERLAQIVGTRGHRHYIMCMGPKNSGAHRIDQFCSIFNAETYISNIDSSLYGYTLATRKSYSCKTKCLKFENGTLNIENAHNYITPVTVDGEPIYDDYDPRILQNNNVSNQHIKWLCDLFGRQLADNDHIYVRPNINGDTPDIVIVRPDKGVLLVNVCESTDRADVERAMDIVCKYQKNIINVHVKGLLGSLINDSKTLACIKMMLYIPNLPKDVVDTFEIDNRYVHLICSDYHDNNQLLHDLQFDRYSRAFTRSVFEHFVSIIASKWHSYRQGEHIALTSVQKPLVESVAGAQRKINGVAGSGKTQVLALRAVNAHLRTGRKVLVLTFNITLVNYLKHRIGKVRADFSWDNIYVSSYHQFFRTMAINHKLSPTRDSYDNENYFSTVADSLEKYAAIFIDEVQDYKTEWLRILHDYFLENDGEFVVFGDAKQNIYNRQLDKNGFIRLDIIGGVWNNSLNRGMRFSNGQLANLAQEYQRHFFQAVEEINHANLELQFDNSCIQYWNIDPRSSYRDIANKCLEVVRQDELESGDIVILSQYCETIRELDYVLRTECGQQVVTTNERRETYDYLKNKYNERGLKSELEKIRRHKRRHFTIDSNILKLSTINSFKGWDSKVVFLILTRAQYEQIPLDDMDIENEHSVIYVAITRARERLYIINVGNETYDNFFQQYSTR